MARYKHIQSLEEREKEALQKVTIRGASERKYNKATQSELFEYILNISTTPPRDNPIDYLYKSNNKDAWSELKTLVDNIKNLKQKDVLINLVRSILKKSNTFINDKDNIKSLKGILEVYEYRIRDIDTWKPKRINAQAQLYDLLNHLFAGYPVPSFLVNGFITYNLEAIFLYCHIGSGKPIRKFEFIPNMLLTNRCFHYLQTTPPHCTFNESFRRSQILSLGGDNRLFHVLMGSKLQTVTNSNKIDPKVEEFWVSVIRFFINNPMINSDKIPEIIDYIYDQKYTVKRIRNLDGVTYSNLIEHPNFSMKDRTPESLINYSDEWHRLSTLNTKREKNPLEWEPINIDDFHYKNGDNFYDIIQLISSKELIQEGKLMHHCVATYASSCARKLCSIFSFRVTNEKRGIHDSPEITLEIRNKDIVQAKARYNAKPYPYYLELVKKWADKNGIGVSKYI